MSAKSPKTRRMRARFATRSRAFGTCDYVVRRIEAALFEHLDLVRLKPETVLDLGCGQGRSHTALKSRYPSARHILLDVTLPVLRLAKGRWPWQRLSKVCADFDALPLSSGSVDLVFSNLSLTAAYELPKVLGGICSAMQSGGLLAFSMLGTDTLFELREVISTRVARLSKRAQRSPFWDMHEVGDALMSARFVDVVMDCERLTVRYKSVLDLLREAAALSLLGPSFHAAAPGPGTKRLAECLTRKYPMDEGRAVATLEVIYGHAWVAQPISSRTVSFGLP